MGLGMRTGIGAGLGKCGHMGKGGQVWMDQTDHAGISDMASWWV